MYKILDDIKNIRKAQGITGYKLAQMVNKKVSFIYSLETKKANPTIETLTNILGVLGYEVRAVKK